MTHEVVDSEAVYNSDPDEIQLAAPRDVKSGDILELPDGRAAVVKGLKGAKDGEHVAAYLRGRFKVRSASATEFDAGAVVGWDDTAKLAVATASGDFDIGIAEVAKVSGQTRVVVALNERSFA